MNSMSIILNNFKNFIHNVRFVHFLPFAGKFAKEIIIKKVVVILANE